MLTHWSQAISAATVAWMTTARRRALDERGANQSIELLGLVALVIAIVAGLKWVFDEYFASKTGPLLGGP